MKKTGTKTSTSGKIKKEVSTSGTIKSLRYSDEELKEFKDLIILKLDEASSDYTALRRTLSGQDDQSTNDTSPTFKLEEDAGDIFSKEEMAAQAIRLHKFIEQLQNALIRIENKTYGICSVTGQLIAKERLKSVPHTTMCVNAKLSRAN
ncbi:MAG: TraR/DksA family transcriptional regulator [Bacteroidetes bacterium]|jgi:RNA polymerase-binding transcription factor DksA|nr:TraR/DksA family transcriptional regulator [Bacteroidota bacterium]